MSKVVAIEFNLNDGGMIRVADAGDHLDISGYNENKELTMVSLKYDEADQLADAIRSMLISNMNH